LLALLCSSPSLALAQERPFPYELTKKDGFIAPIGMASGMLGLYLSSKVDPLSMAEINALDRHDVNGLDRGATHNWSPRWSNRSDKPRNILLASSVLVATGPFVLRGEWSNARTMATLFLEAASLTTAATYIVKGLAGRVRPYAYNTSLTPEERLAAVGPDDPSGRQSFISGHASSAFTAATLLSTIYGDLYGPTPASKIIWVSSLSLASLTAYGRVKAGVHFPTDVLAAALVGTAVGYLVPAIHRRDGDSGVSVSAGLGSIQIRLAVGGD
jgi:membrane-associated phospholipid phosphatase